VFAAGNFGSGSSTSASPANYPEAFAVGATDNNDLIYAYSSRGPSACGETQTIYPELVAPGVNINTTDLYGLYYAVTGTSLAAPHVAGGLALLLSAYPNLTADQQVAALTGTAADLGPVGADNTFGSGRLDLQAAYDWLAGGGGSVTLFPTPSPTAMPTATPTATATAIPPTPTPTATAVPGLHVGDLDRSTTTGASGWTAKVAIEVHSSSHGLVSGATVAGSWSGGYTGTGSCTTDGTGRCLVATSNISKKVVSVMFTVSAASKSGYVYQSASNHDPDGDSNGTAIMVNKP